MLPSIIIIIGSSRCSEAQTATQTNTYRDMQIASVSPRENSKFEGDQNGEGHPVHSVPPLCAGV